MMGATVGQEASQDGIEVRQAIPIGRVVHPMKVAQAVISLPPAEFSLVDDARKPADGSVLTR